MLLHWAKSYHKFLLESPGERTVEATSAAAGGERQSEEIGSKRAEGVGQAARRLRFPCALSRHFTTPADRFDGSRVAALRFPRRHISRAHARIVSILETGANFKTATDQRSQF
jgi:hypothetical protein